MNKFKQVSCDCHQVSLAGGPMANIQRSTRVCGGGGGLYNEVRYIMVNGHMGTITITFPQLRSRAVKTVIKEIAPSSIELLISIFDYRWGVNTDVRALWWCGVCDGI